MSEGRSDGCVFTPQQLEEVTGHKQALAEQLEGLRKAMEELKTAHEEMHLQLLHTQGAAQVDTCVRCC